jgi:hypothetical protein
MRAGRSENQLAVLLAHGVLLTTKGSNAEQRVVHAFD